MRACLAAPLVLLCATLSHAAVPLTYSAEQLFPGRPGTAVTVLDVNADGLAVGYDHVNTQHALRWSPGSGVPYDYNAPQNLGGPTGTAYAVNDRGDVLFTNSSSIYLEPAGGRGRVLLGTATQGLLMQADLNNNRHAITTDVVGGPSWYHRPDQQPLSISIPYAINDINEIVGRDTTGTYVRSEDGTLRYLPLPEGYSGLTPTEINNDSAVTGHLAIAGSQCTRAFLYTDHGGTAPLRLLPGFECSAAADINNLGQIVGVAFRADGTASRPLFWDSDGTAYDLQALMPPGSLWTILSPAAISDAGPIVGRGRLAGSPSLAAFRLTPIPEPSTLLLLTLTVLTSLHPRPRTPLAP